jgi:hypothetical protein
MKTSIAVLGCGSLGYDLASCISDMVGKENLYLTNRNDSLREKYQADGFNVCDNQEAVDQSDYICLLTQPQEVDKLLDGVRIPSDRIVVNFTPKKLNLEQPFIHVACSPVIDGRIRAFLYQKNGQVSDGQTEKFKDIFSPIADYFSECEDSVRELGVMSQVYAHLVSYYDILIKQGIKPDSVKAYFDLACQSLGLPKEKVRTRKGLTDSLFDFEEEHLPNFVNSEREILEERLQWIQTE